MRDADLLLQLEAELRADANPPTLDTAFDPFDLVAVELLLLEADILMDRHIEPYLERYQPQFADPTVLTDFILGHKKKIKQTIRLLVANAQDQIRKLGFDDTFIDPSNEPIN